ncbi:MAG: hypothetical protein GX256_08720 [Fretibacterium sp.]|nr:hypothetical protein [Fretibacterium sp.]
MTDVRVYLLFDDASLLSFDGESFTLHRPPVEIDADLSSLPEGKAVMAWRERRGELVQALESAWFEERKRRRHAEAKQVYSPQKVLRNYPRKPLRD